MRVALDQPRLIQHQARLYALAEREQAPLTDLMRWLTDPANLEAAWRRVSAKDGANTPGVDGVVCGDLAPAWRKELKDLSQCLRHETYQPLPPRWVEIPKHSDPSRVRRIGVLAIRDRIVHAAVKAVLEPVFDPTFAPTSFGFRPGRSVPAALAAAVRAASPSGGRPSPYMYGVHVDVADCFDSLEHRRILKLLTQHVGDPVFLRLVSRLLQPGGRRTGWFGFRQRGVTQGSALSPLLCNLYLHELDEMLADWKRRHGATHALRYADDLLILANSQAAAHGAVRLVRRTLRQCRLRLRNPHERPRPLAGGIRWLGVDIRPQQPGPIGHVRFGYEIPPEKVASMFDTVVEMTGSLRRANERMLAYRLEELNDKLRQWREAYARADNAAQTFASLDRHAFDCVDHWLARVAGQGGRQAPRRFRHVLPSGAVTWEIGGVALLRLSALPLRSSRNLLRRPAWQRAPATSP